MTKQSPAFAIAGAVLLLLGIVFTLMPAFTTTETKEVFNFANLFRVQATEQHVHFIPPLVSTAALILGAIMLAMGFFGRRA
jgi:hypothetical protein